ncbi:MAG: hypothetical protein KDE27_07565 [Planctomycetes bacterium]|nr:hypothetical protein [Planctomycetota bacterium]
MELKEEGFWEHLRGAVARAEAEERSELAEAETLLAEVGDEECEPYSDTEVDEIVANVMAADARAQETTRFPRFGRSLAAAAALLIAHPFVAAAVAVTTATAVVLVGHLRYTTLTLPFQSAIETAMDEGRDEEDRRNAQTTFYSDLLDTAGLLREIREEDSAVGVQASALLAGLLSMLDQDNPFQPGRFPDPHLYLGDLVADRNLALEEREDALRRLAEQMAYGVAALQAIGRSPAPASVLRDNVIYRDSLAREFAR